MPRYWLCVTNEENWRVVKERLIWGVSDRYKNAMGRVEPGDVLIFYVKPKRLGGAFKAASEPFTEKKPVFSSEGFPRAELFPHRVRLEPLIVPEEPVPIADIIPELGFVKNKEKWTGHFRRAMREIPGEDAETLMLVLKEHAAPSGP